MDGAIVTEVTYPQDAAVTEKPIAEKSPESLGIRDKYGYILDLVQRYYDTHADAAFILKIIRGESVSLRAIDWFVTNYSKKNNTGYCINSGHFIVYTSYKSQLKAYTKKLFDPFCRRDRLKSFTFKTIGETLENVTTVGQLNFFRWAYENGVVQYALEHKAEIEADMAMKPRPMLVAKVAVGGSVDPAGPPIKTRKRRTELNQAAVKSVTRHDFGAIRLDFS